MCIYHCGDVSGEVPPVLIPNTEVKLTSAENTLLETARENRLLLHPNKKRTMFMVLFLFCGGTRQPYNKPTKIVEEIFVERKSRLKKLIRNGELK